MRHYRIISIALDGTMEVKELQTKGMKMRRIVALIIMGSGLLDLILAHEHCSNNPKYLYEDVTSMKSYNCRRIRRNEKRRVTLCLEDEVRENCPQTCGICCENQPLYKFETNYDPDKDCDWLARREIRKSLYCGNFSNKRRVKEACPVSCGICQTYVDNVNIPQYLLDSFKSPSSVVLPPPSLSPSPTVEVCKDEETYRHRGRHSCNSIRKDEHRRRQLCLEHEVRQACPVTCGLCCVDDESYTFRTSAKKGQQHCSFLQQSKTNRLKYCDRFSNGQMVRRGCRKSCDNCMPKVKLLRDYEGNDEDESKDRTISGPSKLSQDEEQVPDTRSVPAFLALSLTFISIGVLLSLYGIYSYTRKKMKKNSMDKEDSELKWSESDSGPSIDEGSSASSVSEGTSLAQKMTQSSFVVPTISNIGNKRTSNADVHKCTNFPCDVCARGQKILFVKAPRINVERDIDGRIDFVPVPVNYIGPRVTKEVEVSAIGTLSVSTERGNSSESERESESTFQSSSSLSSGVESVDKGDSETKYRADSTENSHSMLLSEI